MARELLAWAMAGTLLSAMPAAQAANCVIRGTEKIGDCRNVHINTEPLPERTIQGDTTLAGIVSRVTVMPHATLWFSGIANGDIIVMRGARLFVSGIVNGDIVSDAAAVEVSGIVNGRVRANGGTVRVSGIIDGSIERDATARVEIAPGAIVDGKYFK